MRTFNNFNQLSQFKGCGYAVADNAFLGLVDASSPPRVAAEASYDFAHEAPVYLPALKQVGGWAHDVACKLQLVLLCCRHCGTAAHVHGCLCT
jgi:hypothetical protein